MKTTTEKQRKKWEKVRARGFNRYVVFSAFSCGILVTIFGIIYKYVFLEKIKMEAIGWRLIGFSILGLLSGWFTYERTESLY